LAKKAKASGAFMDALNEFGRESGLYRGIGIRSFGKDLSSPFEVMIQLEAKGKSLRINNVGYGVSQALPVVVELMERPNNSYIGMQQPEIHLHPKAQAALGEVLFYAATTKTHHFFVETHSDYIIDRFRVKTRENGKLGNVAQVLFFERSSKGNCIHRMVIGDSGEYPSEQPDRFRNFFLNEHKRILGL
jgi:predicted ATPase